MSFRPATPDDLEAIMVLERASFQGDAWSDAVMRAELASEHTWYVVAQTAGGIEGYAGLRAPAGGTDADVQTIALAESARGRGRGRALLRQLLTEASRRGMREVFLDVRDDNDTAQKLYRSEGFVEIGRRPNYYPAGNVDAVVMRLDVAGWRQAAESSATDAGACS
ncbi:ribosomal protein S18-alanine N-acetyltransferase [Microbacterium sp. P07]|uniref:ribosomal protein S18-alanine N-acetyltransferase n=1 Tax=Microbacterium sp. P07 TaxID=3366952 RepID=UPI00374715DD